MSQLLQILGRGLEYDITELIVHWLRAARDNGNDECTHERELDGLLELFDKKKAAAVEKDVQQYVLAYPKCSRGRLLAAAVAISDGKVREAIGHLEEGYRNCAGNVMVLYSLGHCHERLGHEAEAAAYYQDCLKFKGHLQPPRQRLAAMCLQNGQIDRAIEHYGLLRREYPDDMTTLVMLGYLYLAAGNCEKATEAFDTAILIHPDNFRLENEEIEQLAEAGELDDALDILEYMTQDEPQRSDLHVRCADILNKLNAQDEALEEYSRAVQCCPDSLEANIKLGSQYLRMRLSPLAAAQFSRSAELNEGIVDAYIGLALSQKCGGDAVEAVTTLALAAAVEANSPILFAETAMLQFGASEEAGERSEEQMLRRAIGAHERALQEYPQNPDLHYRLGVLMMRVGQYSEAAALFQNALTLHPTFTRARTKLAISLLESDEAALALEHIGEPVCPPSDLLMLHYKVALLYCDKVRFASSMLNLSQAIDENLTRSELSDNIYIVLQNLGVVDRAVVTCENLTDLARQTMDWQ
jgi:tetratricopeptide (TPR) repeat protein